MSQLVRSGKDDQATEMICELLNQIHFDRRERTGRNLTSLEERFSKLFLRAEKDDQTGVKNSLFIEAAREAKELLRNQQDMVVLHGDVHHENILCSKKRGWLLIDPKGLYGDRAFDALNVLFNPPEMPEVVLCEERLVRTAEALSRGLKIDLNKLWRFAFAYGCLAMVWCLEDGYPIEDTESLVRMMRKKWSACTSKKLH